MLKLGNTSDSSGHGSQRSPRRVLLGLHDLPPLNCEEAVSPQLLATEPLKIKGITRSQSSGNFVFSFPDRSFRLWQSELCHVVSSLTRGCPLPSLPSLLATLRTTPCLPEEPGSSEDADIFSGVEEARFLKVGLLFVSPQKLLALQAYLSLLALCSETPSLPHLMQIL